MSLKETTNENVVLLSKEKKICENIKVILTEIGYGVDIICFSHKYYLVISFYKSKLLFRKTVMMIYMTVKFPSSVSVQVSDEIELRHTRLIGLKLKENGFDVDIIKHFDKGDDI